MLDIICYRAKGDGVCLVDRLFSRRAIRECSGNLRDFGNPAAVGFEFGLYDESQVPTPRALRRFAFCSHIVRMPDAETGFRLTKVMNG